MVVALSVLHTWLYQHTRGSVLLPTLMHAMFNTMAAFVFPAFQGAGYGRLWWIYAGILWVSAFAVMVTANGLESGRATRARVSRTISHVATGKIEP